jgi:superfamily II DNA or RNA helicase
MTFDIQELLTTTKVEARSYQQRIVTKAITGFLDKGYRSIMIDSPTGSGKTIMALLVAKAMQRLQGIRIGWVSMRRNLLSQAHRENISKGIEVQMQMISMFDKNPPTGLDMLVVDEAQHDAAGSMSHIHATVKPRWVLGMTATPFRADRVKLCFDTVIKDAGIHRLIQDGYLSQYHHYTIPDWKPATVVKFFLEERDRWGKSLIYFHTIAECTHCWQLLTEGGVPCDLVTGSSKIEEQLRKFSSGELQVLINCAKLTEGFDAPDLKTVFARPSIKSVTIQMGGRVFRKHPDIPFKQIVQPACTKWPFTRTAGAALMYVFTDGCWRTIQPNCKVEETAKKALAAMAAARAELPEFITKQQAKGRTRRGQVRRNPATLGNDTPESGVEDAPDDIGAGTTGRDVNGNRRIFRSAFDV